LLSPNYQHSEYCQKELDWFYQQARISQLGLTVARESRLFNLLLRNIPPTEWPKELSGTSGFPLHDAPPTSTELYDATDPNSPEFIRQVRKIVDAIEETLKLFPRQVINPTPPEAEKRIKIFLADVPDTLDEVREQLAADLKTAPVEILDYVPPPMAYNDHENRLRETVQTADLTVHLLDELPGRKIIDHKTSTYPWHQTEIALELETPQLIWVPRRLDFKSIKSKLYADFLTELANKAHRGKEYHFIREPETQLSEVIRQKIDEIQSRQRPVQLSSGVLVDTHSVDQRYAYRLANLLTEQGVNTEFTKESRNRALNLKLFEENIQYVQHLVIVFGEVTPNWVLGRLKKTVQILANQFEQSSLQNCWVLLTPPKKAWQPLFNLPGWFHIIYLDNSQSSEISPEVLQPLLDCCQERGRT